MFGVKDVLEFLDGGSKWYKGDLFNQDHTCFCLYGAVCRLDDKSWYDSPKRADDEDPGKETLENIRKSIIANFPDRVDEARRSEEIGCVATFNDHEDTTWEDVEKVLIYAEGLK